MKEINRIVVHHSASPRSTTVETIRGWHLAKGWTDIAYHFIIDGQAALHYGRRLPSMGAHAKGANSDSIGICVVGDNTKPEDQWTADQIECLLRLVDHLNVVWPGLEVFGHREVGTTATECPGIDISTLFT